MNNMNMAGGTTAAQSATITIAPPAGGATATGTATAADEDIVLPLTLRGRPRVTWYVQVNE